MQTFLPFKSFRDSAKALDNKRLNKQILEGYQILKVLSSDDPRAGWRNHPAVKMWRGHEVALWHYIFECVEQADNRGIKTDKNVENLHALREVFSSRWGYGLPEWFTNQEALNRLITTHRANLYTKDPIYYVDFGSAVLSEWNKPCCDRCNYYWVTHVEAV
jgi:hypothetical protein